RFWRRLFGGAQGLPGVAGQASIWRGRRLRCGARPSERAFPPLTTQGSRGPRRRESHSPRATADTPEGRGADERRCVVASRRRAYYTISTLSRPFTVRESMLGGLNPTTNGIKHAN